MARFESVAKTQKWSEDQWAIYLSSLLSGKALDVVHRMEAEDPMDFRKAKETLVESFRLRAEGFRHKFRT